MLTKPEITDLIWQDLNRQMDAIRARVTTLEYRTERSEFTGGVRPVALAGVPLAANGASAGDLLWITDGRKPGELAGAGTGVLAYYNAAGDNWQRASDYTNVVN